jgi:ABC-type transporter Mla subunit MlaD
MLPRAYENVGAIKTPISPQEIDTFLKTYRPPYSSLSGFSQLRLRDVPNKIAHVNGSKTGFAVDSNSHDLLLSGSYHGTSWLAILSLPELCRAIHALPDKTVPTSLAASNCAHE